ncbi:MAG: glycoside hydrolase family 26 protein, partial [Bacteroidia bacterium]
MKKIMVLFCFLSLSIKPLKAQLKFLIEDFEGINDDASELKSNGIFVFGNVKAEIDGKAHQRLGSTGAYAGNKAVKVEIAGKTDFGGWGKGLTLNIELDQTKDYFNFYINNFEQASGKFKIEFQEDDNGDNIYNKDMDDNWSYQYTLNPQKNWELVSIPLNSFKDSNPGGDGSFNVGYKKGKIFSILISFDPDLLKASHVFYFDFLSFSKGKLPVDQNIFKPVLTSENDFCILGAWSSEGNNANFSDIAVSFEKNFKPAGKKLGVVHFFQSFAFDGGTMQNHYPSIERINNVIKEGYVPMITLEDHYVNAHPGTVQPNLYSIVEGHFDSFFGYWANQIKQVNGTVLLRILHEFNGNWYPWCTINNDKDPQLVAKAFRYIINIFRENNVKNVKFIWCPNSMSVPQESWNYIMDAYPGDDYVDYVALDIYNGAGVGKGATLWRSFRKEGIENYFVLTQELPAKPLFICETASRERRSGEA